MRKLIFLLVLCYYATANADQGRNQGAVNNLCQNLTVACQGGDQPSCQAFKDTGCQCDVTQGTCTRGNYSN